jgi:hypothetical protein
LSHSSITMYMACSRAWCSSYTRRTAVPGDLSSNHGVLARSPGASCRWVCMLSGRGLLDVVAVIRFPSRVARATLLMTSTMTHATLSLHIHRTMQASLQPAITGCGCDRTSRRPGPCTCTLYKCTSTMATQHKTSLRPLAVWQWQTAAVHPLGMYSNTQGTSPLQRDMVVSWPAGRQACHKAAAPAPVIKNYACTAPTPLAPVYPRSSCLPTLVTWHQGQQSRGQPLNHACMQPAAHACAGAQPWSTMAPAAQKPAGSPRGVTPGVCQV